MSDGPEEPTWTLGGKVYRAWSDVVAACRASWEEADQVRTDMEEGDEHEQ